MREQDLNPFSTIEIDPEGKTMWECMGIDHDRAKRLCNFASEAVGEWEDLPVEQRRYSYLTEMVSQIAQNPNEQALLIAKVFYYIGFQDGTRTRFRSLLDK